MVAKCLALVPYDRGGVGVVQVDQAADDSAAGGSHELSGEHGNVSDTGAEAQDAHAGGGPGQVGLRGRPDRRA